jgi:hypothetical protein
LPFPSVTRRNGAKSFFLFFLPSFIFLPSSSTTTSEHHPSGWPSYFFVLIAMTSSNDETLLPEGSAKETESTVVAAAATTTADDENNSISNDNNKATSTTTATISKDELIELVRAIKFAKPDASQREVYHEITDVIPTKFPQFAFLRSTTTTTATGGGGGGGGQDDSESQQGNSEGSSSCNIQLNDIKKVWKKASQQQQQEKGNSSTASNHDVNADLVKRLNEMQTIPQMYTVGNVTNEVSSFSSSATANVVATEYMKDFLSKQLEEKQMEADQTQQELQKYVHVFLNVPADKSGSKPHQALINFQNLSKKSNKSTNNNKKKNTKKKAAPTRKEQIITTASANLPFEDAIIVKIQMAAPLGEMDTVKHPMLLYDESRQVRTFVHYDDTETDGTATNNGYLKIAKWIQNSGSDGVLGTTGGTKAYFYSRLTTPTKSASSGPMEDILSIYVEKLAPRQSW